jgi:monoamine oxidase
LRSLFTTLHHRYGVRRPAIETQQGIQQRLSPVTERIRATTVVERPLVSRKKPVAVVVGGGLAGLMAARTLAAQFEVTLFEARERVGGRVKSLRDESTKRIIEAGGELIGYAHPTWLSLAREFELALSVWTLESSFQAICFEQPLFLLNQLVPAEKAEPLYRELDSLLRGMVKDAHQIHDAHEPWKAADAARLDNMSLADWIRGLNCSALAKVALEAQFANTNGAPTSNQSYLANLALVKGAAAHGDAGDFFTMSENVKCAQGNDALASALETDIRHRGGKVHLSTPVEKIRIGEEHVVVTPAHGEPVTAAVVILAIPPTVWSTLSVEPSVPEDCRMTMGTAVKYLSRSPTRFWIRDGVAPSGMSDRCGMTWEGTDNQTQAPGQDVELSLFAGGDAAMKAIEAYEKGGRDAVRRFYDDRISELYPAYEQHRRPSAEFVPWPLEKWTMTGYSCPAPGDVCRVGPNLAKPFAKRLYFAGEHTCLPFFGYMEGALQSGLRTGEAVLKASPTLSS